MTNADLKSALEVTVNRRDLAHKYQDWINQALQSITQKTKWAFLGRKRRDVVVTAGNTSAAMPSDFRALTNEGPAVVVVDGSGAQTPCKVISEENSVNRTQWATMPSYPGELCVYLTPDEEGGTLLNLYGSQGETVTFKVRYTSESPVFEEDEDTSELTERYPLLVEAELFALAFMKVNDFQAAGAWELQAARQLTKAEIDDSMRRRGGRVLRMGG